MAKAAATLLVLLNYLWSKVQADTHILSCNFTVETRSIHTESIPQCSVDGVPLRPYDNDNTRKEGNAPKECADLFSKLEDIGDDSRKQVLTMEDEGYLTRDEHSLSVTLVSPYKEGQLFDAYCSFTLGQHSFTYNLKSRKWTGIHNNTLLINKWKENTELTKHLEAFLIGDCGRCLKKMTRSTSRAPDTGNVTSPSQFPSTMNTTQLPSTMNATQFTSTKQLPSKGGSNVKEVVIPIAIILPVIFCICYMCVKRNSFQGAKMCCICGNHEGQQTPSAVGEPHPEESICMALMSPLEGDSPHGSPASSS